MAKKKKPRDDQYRHDEPGHEEIAIRELLHGDDRTTAIVGATILDSVLEKILRGQFTGSEEAVEELIGVDRPLGSFFAKINLCFVLGIIGEVTHGNLELIRKIRNKFSHTVLLTSQGTAEAISFKTKMIANWCHQLKAIPGWNSWSGIETTEYKFRETCVVIGYGLLQEAETHLKKPLATTLLP